MTTARVLEHTQAALNAATVTIDAEIYRDQVALRVDLLCERAGGRQDDQSFLLQHCARMSLLLCAVLRNPVFVGVEFRDYAN